jgi:mono/diheme cytochrome c family protein
MYGSQANAQANAGFVALMAAVGVFLGAVGGTLAYWEPRLVGAKFASRHSVTAPSPARVVILSASAESGKHVYERHCAGCHGTRGDGRTIFAAGLSPRPRDFTQGVVKFKSTPWNLPPTRDDLTKVVSGGVRWSAMPPYQGRLTTEEIGQVSDYLLESFFSGSRTEFPTPFEPPDAPTFTPAMARAGSELFEMKCASCHGAGGRREDPRPLHDAWGDALFPRDLTLPIYKRGTDPGSLYLRIALGIAGTPMTDVAHGLTSEEIWLLVAHVLSLQRWPESFVDRGALLYRAMGCVQCHGEDGSGGVTNPNYVKGSPPELDTLAERMFLDFEEDTQAFVAALERHSDPHTDDDVASIPNSRRVLGKYDAVLNVIRNGSPAARADSTGPEPPLHMPNWYPHLTDEEIDSLVAYLLSLYDEEDDA